MMPSQVILQPAGMSTATTHFVDTIENLVPIDQISPFVTKALEEKLRSHGVNGRVAVWGVQGADNSPNVGKWDRMSPGDVTLFARSGEIISYATVIEKIHSADLAVELWRRDLDGNTWEYVYFVTEPVSLGIQYKAFNKIVGYGEGYVIRGFTVMAPEKGAKMLNFLAQRNDEDFMDSGELDEIVHERFPEGGKKQMTVNAYERDRRAREKCLEHWGYECQVCEFEFHERYGEIGKDYIHVHHLKPVSQLGEGYDVDPENDLIPVCPNCHAMLHMRKPEPFSIDELKEKIAEQIF